MPLEPRLRGAGEARVLLGDREVEAPRGELEQALFGRHLGQLDPQRRRTLGEKPQSGGNDRAGGRLQHGDPHRGDARLQFFELAANAFVGVEGSGGVRREGGAVIGEAHAASVGHEQRDTGVALELGELLRIICEAVSLLADQGRWKLAVVGDLSLLPEKVAEDLRASVARTADVQGMTVNIAVGYGGRHEITEAVRSMMREASAQGRTLDELADSFTDADITAHLYTKDQPDPDLVIRTSGEQRLSGFMLWQSVHSEYYFCEVYWPDFRRVDFLRALRSYAQRERRMGK